VRDDVETCEIAESELEAVAGGLANGAVTVSGGLAGAVTTDVSNIVNSLETVGYVQGLAGQVTGQVSGITGVHVNTGALTEF
jgi:hypothetical protein